MPSPACRGLCWCKCFSLPCPDDTSPSDMDLLSSKGSALLGPSLSLSLAALSLCSPAPVPSPVPSPGPSAAPQAGSASPPQAPCVFFLPAAQVLPQRAPDAAGAEGGAGLPVPECELCVCVSLAQPWAWPSLGVPITCSLLGDVVSCHSSCPWLQTGPRCHTRHHAQDSVDPCLLSGP